MSKRIKECIIKCPECGTKFNSPIFFGDVATFEAALTMGNITQCINPSCRVLIDCNRENMTYRLADESGGFVGEKFGR